MVHERRILSSDARIVFDLEYRPNLGLATAVSRCVLAFCMRYVRDTEVLSRLRIATQELLENAALYALDGTTRVRIEIAEEGAKIVISVRVTNRAEAEDIARLRESFSGLEQATDGRDHYEVLMRGVAKGERLSGLGLGRIYAEPEMRVGFEVDEDQVSVVATTRCSKEVVDE